MIIFGLLKLLELKYLLLQTILIMLKKDNCYNITVIFVLSFVLFIFFFFHDSIYIIKGDSMEPSLSHGDLLFISKVDPNDIYADEKNGDIVVIKGQEYYEKEGGISLFRGTNNNTRIIHRVIDKRYDNNTNLWYFLTKGDNNEYCDGSIREIYSSENYSLYEYNSSNLVYIAETGILGVVIFKIAYIGLFQDISLGLFILILSFFTLFFIFKGFKLKLKFIKCQIRKKLLHSKAIIMIVIFFFVFFLLQFLPLLNNVYFMINDSMVPYLHFNDLVIAEPIVASKIEINDIVVIKSPQYFYSQGYDPMFWHYYPNSSYIIHRVLDKKFVNDSWYFMTGGDKSSLCIDGMIRTLNKSKNYFLLEFNCSNMIYIPETEILGKVISAIPLIGYIIDYYILILILFIILFSLTIILKLKCYKIELFRIKKL